MILNPTGLETAPTGTVNPTGIFNQDWKVINNIFDPAHVGAQAGVLINALAGMTTITYGASINLDVLGSRPLNLVALAGNLTIAVTNKDVGRARKIIIVGDGTNRTLTWPVGAKWAGPVVTTVPAGTVVSVIVASTTTADSGLVLTGSGPLSYADFGIVPKAYGGTGADNSGLTIPSTGTLATTANVADAVNGLSWKAHCRAKTTANINLSSALVNAAVIDGVTLATGDRVLVASQTAPAENGIYIVAASGAASRAADADTGAELVNASVYIEAGTVAADLQYVCTTNAPITLGSTSITFANFAAGTAYTNGTGISLSGGVFSIDTAWGGQSAIVTVGTLTAGSTGAGFTIALNTATITGTLGAARGGTGADTSAAANDDFMQKKSGAWTYRTAVQVNADLQGDGMLADSAGTRGIPIVSFSADTNIIASHGGKCLQHPSADTTPRTLTIQANGTLALPVGFAFTVDNSNAAGAVSIAITSDTMRLAGAGTTGTRTLAANGIATVLKTSATEWKISGTGLT